MSAQDFRNDRTRAVSDPRGGAGDTRFSPRPAHAGALPSAIFRSLGGSGFARLNGSLAPVRRLRWAAATPSTAADAPETRAPARNRRERANSPRGGGLPASGAPEAGSFQLLWRSLLSFAALRSATAPHAAPYAQASRRAPGFARGPASQLSRLAALDALRRIHDAALIAARRSTERGAPVTTRAALRSIERAHLPARLRSTAGELPRIDSRKLATSPARGAAAVRTSALAPPFAYRSATRPYDGAGVIAAIRGASGLIGALARRGVPARETGGGAMSSGRSAAARIAAWNGESPAYAGSSAIPRAALKLRGRHSRESIVHAVSRHFGAAPGAADLESAPAGQPERHAHASAEPALVIHYAPSFNLGAALTDERIEQAVSGALSSQVPDLLRQMRAEIAKRRRTSFT